MASENIGGAARVAGEGQGAGQALRPLIVMETMWSR